MDATLQVKLVERMSPQRAARYRACTFPARTLPQSAWNAGDGAAQAPGNEHAAAPPRPRTNVRAVCFAEFQTELGLIAVACADEQDAEALSWGRHGRRRARPVGLAFPQAVLLLWPGVTRE